MAPADVPPPGTADVVIVGAGAAGLATAIFAGRTNPSLRIRLLDGAKRPGAKILVSGGSRCNVTNKKVTEKDFWGGRSTIVRRILDAFPASAAGAFFREIGVPLHEEADGKLFPDSGRARDVLEGLLRESSRCGVQLMPSQRVTSIEPRADRFVVSAGDAVHQAPIVVLATGGLSLPKSGSDGAGLDMARRLGHAIVPTTPALAPLVLNDESRSRIHDALSGVAHHAELSIWIEGKRAQTLTGALLWTHFGISGPVALNASRHWLRARLEGRDTRVTLSFLPGETFESLDEWWMQMARARPRATVAGALGDRLPASVAAAVASHIGADTTQLAQLERDLRRALVNALIEWPLAVADSRGYHTAEATAGGVLLDEIRPDTMESRVCPGLFLVGEMLDVDGRLGGFNFQWAWSTGFVAGRAVARTERSRPTPN